MLFLIAKAYLSSALRLKQGNFSQLQSPGAVKHTVEPKTSHFLFKMAYFSVIMFFVFNPAKCRSQWALDSAVVCQ